jgi:ribosomal protein S18 acetylase RimI-like enzyme
MVTLSWRREVAEADIAGIEALVQRTGFFTPAEVRMAGELVEARLEHGYDSGYEFLIGEANGVIAGYTCYGAIEGTESSFDLYWIAVDPAHQGAGIGRQVLQQTEAAMKAEGGSRYYAETSSTDKYAPTRQFYERAGFKEVARIADFYRPGDGKVVYEKLV